MESLAGARERLLSAISLTEESYSLSVPSPDASPLKASEFYSSTSTSYEQGDSDPPSPRADDAIELSVASPSSSSSGPNEPSVVSEATMWTRYYTSEGYEYYLNDATGESSWTLPENGHLSVPASEEAAVPTMMVDPRGRPYYVWPSTGQWKYAQETDWTLELDPATQAQYWFNLVTLESSWHHPMMPSPAEHSTDAEYVTPARRAAFHSPQFYRRQRAGSVSSDGSTSGEDSSDDEDDEDEDDVLRELANVDGAVVGLTLRQRAAWTKSVVTAVGGSLVSTAVSVASSEISACFI